MEHVIALVKTCWNSAPSQYRRYQTASVDLGLLAHDPWMQRWFLKTLWVIGTSLTKLKRSGRHRLRSWILWWNQLVIWPNSLPSRMSNRNALRITSNKVLSMNVPEDPEKKTVRNDSFIILDIIYRPDLPLSLQNKHGRMLLEVLNNNLELPEIEPLKITQLTRESNKITQHYFV